MFPARLRLEEAPKKTGHRTCQIPGPHSEFLDSSSKGIRSDGIRVLTEMRVLHSDKEQGKIAGPSSEIDLRNLLGVWSGFRASGRHLIMQTERKTLDDRAKMSELERIRHSCAHVMATAILRLWPDAQFAYGPPVETGFYYDLHPRTAFHPRHFS